LSGAFIILFALGNILNVFTILGIFFLLGIAGKNSILLVGFANQLIAEGLTPAEAIFKAGRVRLRPILMTSFALIASTLPVALGMSEAAKMRTSMGWAIVGGIISETLLTLVVVPAIFVYVDRYRHWSKGRLGKIFLPK
jgi:HAE1 family hydrophobic/amphiphilic exporter-1